MISFRVTAEEYDRFRQLCLSQGITNISEMARAGFNLLLREPKCISRAPLEHRVTELESRLCLLTLEMQDYSKANR
jgi:hypothetical protein